MDSQWPFGKPSDEPGAYSGDRQTHEDDALRHKHAAENRLTPTGRLKRNADPETFKHNVRLAVEKIKALIEKYPDHADRYGYWLREAEALAAKAK